MGNTNQKSRLSNQSKRNVRVFFSDTVLEIDAFIVKTNEGGGNDQQQPPGVEKFSFRKDLRCVRVLASQNQELPLEENQFVSILVEDEDDEGICSKQIVQSMAFPSPVTVILYDF